MVGMMKKTLVFFILLINILHTAAADFKLNSRRVTTADGLSGNTINELLQDRDGYIWLATNNGLSRFDGYHSVNYSSLACDDKHHLEARIGRIFADTTRNLLWLSTATYQNACYDLGQARFVDWSGRGDCYGQQNKLMLTSRGMVLYGNHTGAQLSTLVDGLFTTTHYSQQDGTLPDDNVVIVAEDLQGRLWLPTSCGFSIVNTDGTVSTVKSKQLNIIAAIARQKAYFLTADGELLAYDGKRLVQKAVLPPAVKRPSKVHTSFLWQGRWMLFSPEGTYAIDLATLQLLSSPANQLTGGQSQGVCDGYHFIGTRDGVLWIFPDEGEPCRLDLIPNARYTTNKGWLFHITKDAHGRLFIATYGAGLYVYDVATSDLTHYTASDESPIIDTDYLTCAATDRQGGIWLGSETTGAYCLTITNKEQANYIKPYPMAKGDWSNTISSAVQQDDGLIIMGTRNGDIYQTRADGTLSPQLLGKKMIAVRGLYLDSSNQLWTGTWGQGLHAPAGRLAEQTNPPLFINDIMEDSSGQIWIATWNNGILKVNGNELQQVSKGNMNGNRVSDLEEAADGSIWAATNDGLCQLTRDGRQFLYNTRNGLFPNDEVTALLFDAATGLWVATAGGGVVRCRFGNLETYTTSNGMSNNNVTSLVRDINGRIWAGTEDGLSVIDPQHGTISTYRPSESLKGNSVTNNCALLTKDGKLLFGTADGLLVIDPTQFRKTAVLQPTITALTVNGTALLKERPATLRHDQNQLTFYFSVFEYNKQQLPMFQYYLQGLEADWQHITPQNSVSYSELPPGDYVFHVRSFGTHGQYQQETTYAFTISQPWYNRWWAWMLYLLVVTLTLLYVWRNARERFRLHQQMNMERQLNNFRVELFTNITHEFRTPLAIIKSAVDKLSQDGRNAAAQQTARRATSRLLRMVNQLMEYRKINTDNLRLQVEPTDIIVFVGQIVQDLREMAAQKEQRLKFIPFDKHHEMLVDRQMVETIIYNLLSNAVKYTPEKGSITVRVQRKQQQEGGSCIQIVVEDTGPGISPQQQARLFKPFMQGYVSQGGMGIGLYTAHRMATLHHGTLEYSQCSIHNAQCTIHNAQSAAAKDGAGNNCALSIEHCALKKCFTLSLPAEDSCYTAEEMIANGNANISHQTSAISHQTSSIIREMLPEAFNDMTVAIIEDNPDMMQQLCTEVGQYFHTVSYTTGKRGYEGVASEPPALLLCDVMLPDMDGYEIVSRLKADANTAALPVIMLTALDDESHQIRAYKAGADDYMVKPCNFRLLLARMVQLIKWSRPQVPPQADAPAIIEGHLDKVFVEKLEMLTARHLGEESFTVDRMAELMNMGRTKFYGKVKELTGMSPNKYLQDARMRRAAELLLEGELNISEVCYKVGMQDPTYFNKVFKARYGVVPSKYGK